MTLQTCALKISAGVNGVLRGGSSVRRPGSKDPHRCQQKFLSVMLSAIDSTDNFDCKMHRFRNTFLPSNVGKSMQFKNGLRIQQSEH